MPDIIRLDGEPGQPGFGEPENDEIKVAQWWWCEVPVREWDDDEGMRVEKTRTRFCCVTHVGSNYAEVSSIEGRSRNSATYHRIHFDEWDKRCKRELNPQKVIDENVDKWRGRSRKMLLKIQELTARLGVSPRQMLPGTPINPSEETHALTVVSDGGGSMKQYKADLIKAKEETLPKLFKSLEHIHERMAIWMTAEKIGLEADCAIQTTTIELVENRIFNVGLYAGLSEECKKVKRGRPADITEKLHVMQRMHFMDEECVSAYKPGGICCQSIRDFDKWLVKAENYTRLLPFERCCIAMRVRRWPKEREWDGTIAGYFVNMRLANMDTWTFLYIRNGRQIWRVNTEVEFGWNLFPDLDEVDFTEEMMGKGRGDDWHFVTVREYEELVKKEKERRRKHDAWAKKHPNKHYFDNPHRHGERDLNSYKPFNDSSVYFDDMHESLNRDIQSYNRIGLILQGIYDRSEILHPHPPVKLYTPEGFAAAIKLVRDNDMCLPPPVKPDFMAYTDACNAQLKTGSVTIGQEDYWEEKMAHVENSRMDRDWRETSHYRHKRYSPYGDPGPGLIAKIDHWQSKARKARYEWYRERKRYNRWGPNGPLRTKVIVPEKRLFNISAYKPGDFKQFFEDHRTRRDYLKWVPQLLSAEEHHAGNPDFQPRKQDE